MTSSYDAIQFGLTWSDALTDVAAAKECARIARLTEEKTLEALAQTAQKRAIVGIANEVMRELAAVEAGQSSVRRLSDPANVAARAKCFMDTAEGELNRMSAGNISFTDESHANVKTAGCEISDYFERGLAAPAPQRGTRVRR